MIQSFLRARERARLDECLPEFLSMLTLELEIRTPLSVAISRAGEHVPSPLRESMVALTHAHVHQGRSLEEALGHLAQEWESPAFSRVIVILIHLSTEGSTPESIQGLRRLEKDLRNQSHTRMRAFESKLTVLALVFIGVSTLVPAFFLAFVTIGSRFLSLSVTPLDVFLLSGVGFPMLDALILGIVWIQTPPLPLSPKKERSFREFVFLGLDSVMGASFFRPAVIEGASFFIMGWTLFLYAHGQGALWGIFLAGCAVGPLLAHFAWSSRSRESRIRTMERQLPDSLILLSAFPPTRSFVKNISTLGENTPFPIREEWLRLSERIKQGENARAALATFGESFSSRAFAKTRHLLIRGYESGTPLGHALSELAQDLLTGQVTQSNRQAVLGVEKYTLLAAGGVLIPILLGVLVGVVSSLPFSLDTGSGAQDLFEAARVSTRVYLGVYSVLAGLFVGLQENRSAQGVGYALILVPVSQIMYSIGMRIMQAA